MVRGVDGLWKTEETLSRPLVAPSGSCSKGPGRPGVREELLKKASVQGFLIGLC